MTAALDEARAALYVRQGTGARYDAAAAPARELGWARRATAYMARLLGDLTDEASAEPSRLPEVSRRRIVAGVGLGARFLAEAVAWVRAEGQEPLPSSFAISYDELALTETLPARALRNLVQHAAITSTSSGAT